MKTKNVGSFHRGSLQKYVICIWAKRFLFAAGLALLASFTAKAGTESSFKTYVDDWASCTRFRGPSVTLTMFNNGSPQLALSQENIRIGGVVIMNRSEPLNGVLKKVDARTRVYTFEQKPGLELKQTLDEKGLIHCKVSGAGDAMPVVFSLLSAPFSNSALKIDGRVHVIEPEKAGDSAEPLTKGEIKEMIFFADRPERKFSIALPDGGTAAVYLTTGAYGLTVKLIPPWDKSEFEFTILPGPSPL